MITKINESKTLKNHISCDSKYIFDGKNCKSNQIWNKNKCQCERKN